MSSSSRNNKSSASSRLARVEHPITKHVPIMTEGKIVPKVMRKFEIACNNFFDYKVSLADADKVRAVLCAFQDEHIADFIETERTRLIALTFPQFMAELRTRYLDPEWDSDLKDTILQSTMLDYNTAIAVDGKDGEDFFDWAKRLEAKNMLLRGTTYHMTEDALKQQLQSAMDRDLRRPGSKLKADAVGAPGEVAKDSKKKGKAAAVNVDSDDDSSASIKTDDESGDSDTVFVNGALANTSGSSAELSSDVSPPLICKLYVWKCRIKSDSVSNFTVKALLDGGASVVLIRKDVVDRASLPTFSLDSPISVDVALPDGKKKFRLQTFVKLRVSSPDSIFHSRIVHAMVTSTLIMNLILVL
ncbi:hypothetical protein CVT24_002631 [Panaeolus cyanescens]|uniref:Uncharacterized protein n=1 Tax=Panaeolus cyanescens TaxID=181874 RepID=A0A409YU12_9AGAR|nr:hypothetical protein CVT24_002631 [Panaeolus cyanescens]